MAGAKRALKKRGITERCGCALSPEHQNDHHGNDKEEYEDKGNLEFSTDVFRIAQQHTYWITQLILKCIVYDHLELAMRAAYLLSFS
jgi:hypothetical protein